MRFFTRPPVWGVRGMLQEHKEKGEDPPSERYPGQVRRRWLGVITGVAVAVVIVVSVASRGGSSPARQSPSQVRPSQQTGDDADLMRRLERRKLVQRSQ